MNVLDLFAGIGGFALGLERAGHTVVGFCEIDPYCQAVLKKQWPKVPCFPDVRELARRTGDNEPEDEDNYVECTIHRGQDFGECPCIGTDQLIDTIGPVDVLCGGFPCEDISLIGRQAGIERGERSGLWSEFARIIGELGPRIVIVENVTALLGRDIGRVLGDLAEVGYDAEWHCIPASAVGAPHRRDRVWIVGHPSEQGLEGYARDVAPRTKRRRHKASAYRSVAAPSLRLAMAGAFASVEDVWAAEPSVGRVADGVPDWVDRLECLGDAVVPQIPEAIGRAISHAAL